MGRSEEQKRQNGDPKWSYIPYRTINKYVKMSGVPQLNVQPFFDVAPLLSLGVSYVKIEVEAKILLHRRTVFILCRPFCKKS